MDPNQAQNTGSFGAAIGGADALKAAMQRRGMDASVLDQVSPAAPGPQSAVASPIEGITGVGATVDQTLQPTQGAAETAPPARSAEAEIALKALSQVARTEAKIAESLAGLR